MDLYYSKTFKETLKNVDLFNFLHVRGAVECGKQLFFKEYFWAETESVKASSHTVVVQVGSISFASEQLKWQDV